MRFQISFYFNRKLVTTWAEQIEHTPGKIMRYRVEGKQGAIIIYKSLDHLNLPWQLESGIFHGNISTPDKMDMVRSIGAAIERGGH